MELINIQTDGKQYQKEVWELYEEAFPAEEKKPRALMENLASQGKMELLAVVDDQEFIGFAFNMFSKKTALLDYLAISSNHRSSGYGSLVVKELVQRFLNKKYILEIEMQDETAPNAYDRKRRKAFYLRNGLKETGVFANVYDTDFELLTPDGELTYETYLDVLITILGEHVVKRINPILIREGASEQPESGR